MEFRIENRKQPISVNVDNKEILLEKIGRHFAEGTGFSVATVNLDHLVKLQVDGKFYDSYQRQTYVVADGHPIVWLSILAGKPVHLAPGSELIEPICELAAEKSAPVALVGSTDDVLQKASAYLTAKFPNLRIVCCISPSMNFDPDGTEADDIIEKLRENGVALCFLAMGAPRQENFSARAFEKLPNTGFVSIGAGLDFLAGYQTRAPLLFRRLALEWLWRLMLSPRRLFMRYFKCGLIVPGFCFDALKQRFKR